ncbi:MAG TPA: DoxX family protein [Caldimonas sp.]|jgi:putative oxidoreductase
MTHATLAAAPPRTPNGTLLPRLVALGTRIGGVLGRAAPLADLAVRWFVAAVFFQSGLTKIANWDSTLSLFENEYAVPLLPSSVAAFVGTGVELFFPVLLVLGLGTRFAAFALFVFNIVAVVSYPDLGAAGLKDHQLWGLLLLVTLLHGPGALSLDRAIGRLFGAPGTTR